MNSLTLVIYRTWTHCWWFDELAHLTGGLMNSHTSLVVWWTCITGIAHPRGIIQSSVEWAGFCGRHQVLVIFSDSLWRCGLNDIQAVNHSNVCNAMQCKATWDWLSFRCVCWDLKCPVWIGCHAKTVVMAPNSSCLSEKVLLEEKRPQTEITLDVNFEGMKVTQKQTWLSVLNDKEMKLWTQKLTWPWMGLTKEWRGEHRNGPDFEWDWWKNEEENTETDLTLYTTERYVSRSSCVSFKCLLNLVLSHCPVCSIWNQKIVWNIEAFCPIRSW